MGAGNILGAKNTNRRVKFKFGKLTIGSSYDLALVEGTPRMWI